MAVTAVAVTVPQVYPGTSLIIAESIGTPVCSASRVE